MSRGKKKEVEDQCFLEKIEKVLGRPLESKEKQDLATAARNFIRDNFAVTDVYDMETIEEACGMNDDKWPESDIEAEIDDDFYRGTDND